MDAVRIIITRGCNADGTGGTVVDDASGILGTLQDGTAILDAVCAAFADAYGVYRVPAPTEEDPDATEPVSLYRNLSYRLRTHATEIVTGYLSRQAAAVAAAQAAEQSAAAMAAVQVVNH